MTNGRSSAASSSNHRPHSPVLQRQSCCTSDTIRSRVATSTRFPIMATHEAGRPDLADKVEWVAEYDSTVGYDILSYGGGKSKVGVPDRFVEVKSTPTDRFHFFLSGPELRKARE